MNDPITEPIENVVDGLAQVASTWLKVGIKLSQTAISMTADGLQATADAISKLAEDIEDDVERNS